MSNVPTTGSRPESSGVMLIRSPTAMPSRPDLPGASSGSAGSASAAIRNASDAGRSRGVPCPMAATRSIQGNRGTSVGSSRATSAFAASCPPARRKCQRGW